VVVGTTGAADGAGAVLPDPESLAEGVGVADPDGLADADPLAEAEGLAEVDALTEAEGLAEAVGEAESVGSAFGATAPAGAARLEKRRPAPSTATVAVTTEVPIERLICHMRSIITRVSGGGSNRGNLGESVDSSEGSLLTRGVRT
jgi:hypothetical protein